MCKHFVVPSICSRDVACAERPNVRRFEHFLQLLDLIDDALNVHPVPISNMGVAIVKRSGGQHISTVARWSHSQSAPENVGWL